MDLEPRVGDETADDIVRRIRRISMAAYVAFAIFVGSTRGFAALVGLTCSATVVMINFLWLEQIVTNLLQPTPHLRSWRLVVRAVARFVLLGVALTVTIYIARFDVLSVLLGFSIVVVGIMGEAAYETYASFVG